MSLDNRTIALISVGTSIGANCQPCLQYSVSVAREMGISEEDIREAIDAGRFVRKGAANKMDKYVLELCSEAKAASMEKEAECGCGCN